MIRKNKISNKHGKTSIKLNNVCSIKEGWQYINTYAQICCLEYGYDEYGICQFYEDRAYASVVFFFNNEIMASCTFDISEFEKFSDFSTNKPYKDFVYTKVGKKYVLSHEVVDLRDIQTLRIIEPRLCDYGIKDMSKVNYNALPDPEQVQMCIDWLSTKIMIPTKTVSFDSSNIKGLIERELKTYVTNGAVIAAVLHLGIPYERIEASPKVKVFLLKKEIFSKPRVCRKIKNIYTLKYETIQK